MTDRDPDPHAIVSSLLERHGRTYADELGLDLDRGTPTAMFGLLLFTLLSSTRIRAANATEGTRALLAAGLSSAAELAESTWEQRVKVLNQHGYARYDERAATELGELAEHVQARWNGDLGRLRKEADGDVVAVRRLLTEFTGIGPVGADIYLREAQQAWPEFRPSVDGAPGTPRRRWDCPHHRRRWPSWSARTTSPGWSPLWYAARSNTTRAR